MAKIEKEVVTPLSPILYTRYVDDIFCRKEKGEPDELFQKLNQHHPNIKFTKENNLNAFLDTEIKLLDGTYHTNVYRRNKLPVNWNSKIPKKFKRNALNTDLHRAHKIASSFENELTVIRKKYKYADYPVKFTESVIRQFKLKIQRTQETINLPEHDIPPEGGNKRFIPIYIPYCESNENISQQFLKRINNFTNDKFKPVVMWKTKRIKSLFQLKDKITHKANVIYEGVCTCSENYTGETKINTDNRWGQHNNIKLNSNPAQHLNTNKDHSFTWRIIRNASQNDNRRKILEALYIAKFKPSLNEHINYKLLNLFKHGIT